MTKTLKMSGESHAPHPSFLILNSRMVPHIARHGPPAVVTTSDVRAASSDSGSDPPDTKILTSIHSLTRMLSKVPIIILKVAETTISL